jgi:flagellar basal-body rod protein FlgF
VDRLLYIANTGASQALNAQAAVGHNLANADTTGFRADLNQFRAQPVFGPVHPSRVYAMDERPGVDLTPGPLISTGRDLDLAVDGDGYIAVQAADGGEAYTRAGDLQVGPGGVLTTGRGDPVLGEGGPVAVPPFDKLEIGSDGTVSIVPLGQDPNTLAVVDRIRLVRPDPAGLEKGADGLLRLAGGAQAPPDAGVRLASGHLEGSNVNPVDALVDLIAIQRRFEMQVQMMRKADENAQAAEEMLRL